MHNPVRIREIWLSTQVPSALSNFPEWDTRPCRFHSTLFPNRNILVRMFPKKQCRFHHGFLQVSSKPYCSGRRPRRR